MVEFKFSVHEIHDQGIKPWLGHEHDTPEEAALRLWIQFSSADEDMDFATAVELAPFDREVYDAFQIQVWAMDVEKLPQSVQAAVGRVLGQKPPRKGKGATARRDARMRAVAEMLVRDHGVKISTNEASENRCAASIISQLPELEMLGGKRVQDIVTKSVR